MADCEKCARCIEVHDGVGIRCRLAYGSGTVPWSSTRGRSCDDFELKPAASPPVSADREGPDVLVTLRRAKALIGAGWNMAMTHNYPGHEREMRRALDELDVAISSEEARRARPAEDPRDALLWQCAEFFSNSAYKWTLKAATDRRIATAGLMLDEFNEVAASLRSAGVEPAPEAAQERKASRPATVRHGETCEKAAHSGTGYLHDENDDTPYDVDGLLYCGRCHGSIDAPEGKASR